METCRHNINKKYCKACKKFATILTKSLYYWANNKIISADKLIKDMEANKIIPNIDERLNEIAKEIKGED